MKHRVLDNELCIHQQATGEIEIEKLLFISPRGSTWNTMRGRIGRSRHVAGRKSGPGTLPLLGPADRVPWSSWAKARLVYSNRKSGVW